MSILSCSQTKLQTILENSEFRNKKDCARVCELRNLGIFEDLLPTCIRFDWLGAQTVMIMPPG